MLDFLLEVFKSNAQSDAIVWKDESYSYAWLLERFEHWSRFLSSQEVSPGEVVVLEADFSPEAVALFLALLERRNILVPLTSSVESKKAEFIDLAAGQVSITIDSRDRVEVSRLDRPAEHGFYQSLRKSNSPGLVLFSSGSSGKSKAAVHDLTGLLEKFKIRKRSFRTISFLLYDHIGGINTMLYTLSNAGCLITVQDRSPDAVLSAIERYQVELLPTSPTFINLILLSEAYKNRDLSSLKIVTYGTEPMPESTLLKFHELFPQINLLQTYGLSEVGILRSRSKSSDSLWLKVGGEGYQTRVVDGIFQIKAESAMLGYLNAASPFTEDGWFNTGDAVEVDGDYIKFLGRKSEIINVGGEKVYPQEVENVIQELAQVGESFVYGEKNAIVGNIVCAEVRPAAGVDKQGLAKQIKKHCSEKLEAFKVPVRIKISERAQHSERFKKTRV